MKFNTIKSASTNPQLEKKIEYLTQKLKQVENRDTTAEDQIIDEMNEKIQEQAKYIKLLEGTTIHTD